MILHDQNVNIRLIFGNYCTMLGGSISSEMVAYKNCAKLIYERSQELEILLRSGIEGKAFISKEFLNYNVLPFIKLKNVSEMLCT